MDLQTYLKTRRQQIDAKLEEYFNNHRKGYPAVITQAIRYSLLSGGKRIRPIITLAVAEMLNGDIDDIILCACALEMVHTCSLILDDLPCMDNAEYRRGKLVNHKVFGEDIAILASLALLNHAYGLVVTLGKTGKISAEKIVHVLRELSDTIGIVGVIGGQVVDLQMVNRKVNLKQLKYIYHRKTGALFVGSARVGAILGGANRRQLSAITQFAKNFGLAYQIIDDLLDCTGAPQIIGKNTQKDNNKPTFLSFYKVEQARNQVKKLTESSIRALSLFGGQADLLRELVRYLSTRNY